jgi:hypothetical protein
VPILFFGGAVRAPRRRQGALERTIKPAAVTLTATLTATLTSTLTSTSTLTLTATWTSTTYVVDIVEV